MPKRDRNDRPEPIEDPAWLLDPPDGAIPAPPATTRAQILPFGQLTPLDFERLCLRLARLEGEAEHWQLYGTSGQNQGGIDIYVRRLGATGYDVWQCKRHTNFGASLIRKAVADFLKGEWASRAERFVLCTSARLDETAAAEEIERQAALLQGHGIRLSVRDEGRLSDLLKEQPQIVDDFFDRPWTERFCGHSAAASLGARLNRASMSELRSGLGKLYENLFAVVDPGVLRATSGLDTPPKALPLARRFVAPSLATPDRAEIERHAPPQEPRDEEAESVRRWSRRRAAPAARLRPRETRSRGRRTSLIEWSTYAERSIILGDPGSGKSTLLRFIALDMLSPEPRLPHLRRRWPAHLPVLLPFAFWTRLLAQLPAGRETSVSGAAEAWLDQLGAPELARHVAAAFADRRVTLLVDGVDEWADEGAAQAALTILHTFAVTSGIPTIVTSRPHGSRVLGTLDASWVRHSLAPLDSEQKREFARVWFEWLREAEGGTEGERQAQARADAFVSELDRQPHVMALAGTPLLLSGLMAIVREGGTLPGSRREAYGELVDRVLESHPRSRIRAALIPPPHGETDANTRRRALAALAYHMQERPDGQRAPDGLGIPAATLFLRNHLISELDLPPDRARKRAGQLVSVGAEAIGILVERAPGEIGFLHRAFQELLAAEHLAGLDLAKQCSTFTIRAHDAQWRDILLFAVQMSQRTSDVENLVEALETAAVPSFGGGTRDLLLAEIAFGVVRRPPRLTRRLTARFLDEVELGDGKADRAEVMRLAINGLLSEQTVGHVIPRLRRWFPSLHHYHYADALEMMQDWSEPEVDTVMLRSLDADDEGTRTTAAKVLAKRNGGNPDWLAALLRVTRRPPSIEAAAAAVRCLALGWSSNDAVEELVDSAATSPNWQVASAGLEARIAAGRQTKAERDALIQEISRFGFERTSAASDLLAKGWPNDPDIRSFVMGRLRERDPLFQDIQRLAAKGFPGDHEMAMALAKQLTSGPGHIGIDRVWKPLAQAHQGDGPLADALTIGTSEYDKPYILAHAARIARTPAIRRALLDVLNEPDRIEFWAVGALIDHWPDDPEVKSALAAVLDWPMGRLLRVAEYVPRIDQDPERAKRRVRELALHALEAGGRDLAGPMNVLTGAKAVDAELAALLVDAAERADFSDEDAPYLVIAAAQADPTSPRVHRLARAWLRKPGGLLGVLALLLRDEPSVRADLIECCAPLPQPLRSELSATLYRISMQSDEALKALEEAASDGDQAIAADATISHAAARHLRGDIDQRLLDSLEAELQAKGSYLEGKRLAALGGLIFVDRSDLVLRGARAQDGLKVGLSTWRVESDGALFEALADHWQQVERLQLDGSTWLKIGDAELIARLARYANGRPGLEQAVRAAADRLAKAGEPTLGSLRIQLQDPRSAAVALKSLIEMLRSDGSWSGLETSLGAAQMLAQAFHGQSAVGQLIENKLSAGEIDGPVAALCDGWANSKVLRAWFESLRAGRIDQDKVATPVKFKVVATLSAADVLVRNLVALPDQLDGEGEDGVAYWTGSVRSRFAGDDDAYARAEEALRTTASPGARASLASLLVQARGLTPELQEWMAGEIERAPPSGLAEVGMDIVAGHHVVLAHRFARLLEDGGASV